MTLFQRTSEINYCFTTTNRALKHVIMLLCNKRNVFRLQRFHSNYKLQMTKKTEQVFKQ